MSSKGKVRVWLAAIAHAVLLMTGTTSARAEAPAASELSRSGVLEDGTAYGIVVPKNWNGTLLLDLDFLTRWQSPVYQQLFARGYAAAGVTRNYTDPPGGQFIRPWVDRTLLVADRFTDGFGKPRRLIAWGVSRGGHVAMATAQLHPERIDAAIPKCIYGGAATLMNQDLDLMFALKALLAADSDKLPLVNVSAAPATPAPVGFEASLAAWNALLTEAQSTPEGRARIALAAAIAHLPDWVDAASPRPDARDVDAVQAGWFRNIRARLGPSGTFSFMRPVFETSAGGNFSWNAGVDYRRLLTSEHRRTVETLYAGTDLELTRDLERIERSTRISPDAKAAWFAEEPSVTMGERFGVPVLVMNTIGDPLLPVTGTYAISEAARRRGDASMLRMTFTEAVGHCNFSVAEDLAVVETMTRRLDSGRWGNSTVPSVMNRLAASFGQGGGKFIDYRLPRVERAFVLGDRVPPPAIAP